MPIESLTFSAGGYGSFSRTFGPVTLARNILVCGIEGQCDVAQTILDLLADGWRVFAWRRTQWARGSPSTAARPCNGWIGRRDRRPPRKPRCSSGVAGAKSHNNARPETQTDQPAARAGTGAAIAGTRRVPLTLGQTTLDSHTMIATALAACACYGRRIYSGGWADGV